MANNPSAKDIADLWTAKKQEFTNSRSRIKEVREWLAHRKDPKVPPEFENQLGIGVKLPHPVTQSLHTLQVMGRKRPLYKREPQGRGNAPQRKSTKIETFANGLLSSLEQQQGPIWKPLIGALFNQAECAVLCYPTMAHWEQFPDFEDESGEPHQRYQRDAKDRDPEDDYYQRDSKRAFKMDGARTKDAFKDASQDFRTRRIPLTVRIVTAAQCLPIFGPGLRLDGLLIRSAYTEESLRMEGYSWHGGAADTHPGTGRGEDERNGSYNRSVELTELWTPGSVCYYAGLPSGSMYERTTLKKGEDEGEAHIDLAGEYGLTKMLAHYVWGAHWPDEENPDDRGMPFLWPFIDSYAGMNSLASAQMGYAWRFSFGGVGIEPNESILAAAPELLIEDGKPRTFKIEPMTAMVLPGKVQSLSNTGTGPDVMALENLLMGANREESPDKQALGGSGAPSGRAQSMQRLYLEDTHDFTLGNSDDYSGALGAWRWIGQTALEVATRIAETQKHAVAVAVSVSADSGTRTDSIELGADLCDGVFDLSAYYPTQEGENLPFAQMLADWEGKGLASFREFREKGMGDPSPEKTMAEIEADNFLRKDPQGRMLLMERVAEELADQRMQEVMRLAQQGEMHQDGTPTSATSDLPGTQLPNATKSAVGGMVAGELGGQALVDEATMTAA